MNIIGAIQAYNEADKIAGAVESLFAAGCDRVVVVDGPWLLPDGSPFGGGKMYSTDGTHEAAMLAGAVVVVPSEPMYGDGGKRHEVLRHLIGQPGDFIFLLDADERIQGTLERENLPESHAVVMLRNLRPNDLPGIRGVFPHGDYGPSVPLLRWLRWSQWLSCEAPGRYSDEFGEIEPYIEDITDDMTPEQTCALPILQGVEILHAIEPSEERVAAKVAYYEALMEPVA